MSSDLLNKLLNTFYASENDRSKIMFLLKKGKIYNLEYFDEYENRKKRVSTSEIVEYCLASWEYRNFLYINMLPVMILKFIL